MLVNLRKNPWLHKWIQETVDPNHVELKNLMMAYSKTRPENIYKNLALKLIDKGYKVKLTNTDNVIISMSEEEFVFLKLKYE